MKTIPMMLQFLPRFRWFCFGFALCATGYAAIDGHFSTAILILILLGALTYTPEAANQRLSDNQKRLDEIDAKRREMP